MPSPILFSTINVSRQVFHKSALSYAIVNLKPIVDGHVLVIPTRPVPFLADLNHAELTSLMLSVQQVGNVIKRVYGADALTIACQDGPAAGQSIPHVHFHLLPRKLQNDRFARSDDVYPALEKAEGSMKSDMHALNASEPFKVDADEDRKPRTLEEMEKEAVFLKDFFP